MYISVNQSFIKEEDAQISIMPWHLQMQGCILTEHIRANAAKSLLTDKHFDIIAENAKLLKFDLPKYFTVDFLTSQIAGVLTRNKQYQAADVQITMTRDLASGKIEIVINSRNAGDGPYEQNRQGLMIDVFSEAYVTTHRPSQLDQHCNLVGSMAKATAIGKRLDDMLLITEQGFIVGATQANFFAIKGDKLLTPPLELGARHDVLSDLVISSAQQIGFKVDCEALIMAEDLLSLEEVFLCDTANGLQWVSGFKNHRYIHKDSKRINEALNKCLFA